MTYQVYVDFVRVLSTLLQHLKDYMFDFPLLIYRILHLFYQSTKRKKIIFIKIKYFIHLKKITSETSRKNLWEVINTFLRLSSLVAKLLQTKSIKSLWDLKSSER
jgi:hypothetical protein